MTEAGILLHHDLSSLPAALKTMITKPPAITCRTLVLLVALLTSSLAQNEPNLRSRMAYDVIPPKTVQHYELWEPKSISETLLQWANHYPDLIRVTTAQEAFGLPRAGGADDCPFDEGGDGCLNYFFIIQDFLAHPEGSDSSKRLPEVLWSGELHGNEQVGPTAVLEAAQLLMDAASCEAIPRAALKGSPDWKYELSNAETCRKRFEDFGISDGDRRWLARLVSTRRIVVVPTANALGYFRVTREEGQVDPNRDFPYDLLDVTQCMQTIAGRTLNEIFRQHMFQLSLTFHGGMEVIGYEWGAPSWNGPSPDDIAQHSIAAAYSHYGGGWADSKPYDFGNMNDLVYPVRGGMEDWAYAGSWDPDRVVQCKPTTFGGYPEEKTVYSPGTLRVFNMLVESSNRKIPPKEDLGTSEDLLNHGQTGNGYVSRNIRLSLLAAELVEPYVAIRQVNELLLSDDIVPLVERGGRSCQETKAAQVPHNIRKVVVQWTVGGALTIDSTQLWYAKWSDIPEDNLDCMSQPTMDVIKQYMKEAEMKSATSGKGRFSLEGPSTPFVATVDISDFAASDKIVVVASARVDQDWASLPSQVTPNVSPQSHVVNVRTNSSWHFESNEGLLIQGRLDWFSIPATIVLAKVDEKGGDSAVSTIELSSRFVDAASKANDAKTGPSSYYPPSNSTSKTPSLFSRVVTIFVTVAAVVVAALGARYYLTSQIRQKQRSRIREFIEDENAPSPGLREKSSEQSRRNGYTDIPETTSEVELT